jgi:hypothetical protein
MLTQHHSSAVPFDEINDGALVRVEELLAGWLPGGRVVGREYSARNPTRNDQRPGSFRVNIETGKWSDFATGDKGGDLISLYAYLNGQSQGDAARAIAAMTDGAPLRSARTRTAAPTEPRVITPVPDAAPAPVLRHREHGTASQHWPYRDAEGRMLGYVVRFETPSGKQILPLTYCEEPDGRRRWRWHSWAKPRPLYGLDRLAARPDAPVLVTEGEKAADAAERLFAEYVAITSPGGSKAAAQADWSAVRGREVAIWPDADEPGKRYAAEVTALVQAAGAQSVRVVALPPGLPEGWDLADPLPENVTIEMWETLVKGGDSPAVCSPDWPEPKPLPDALPGVPALPLGLIPAPLRDWIGDAADRLQVPVELIATPALVAAAALVGRAVGIYPKQRDDWLVIGNLWGIIIGRPGVLKSPAVREGTRFVRRLAAEASERHAIAAKAADIESTALTAELAAAKRPKKGTGPADLRARIAELHERIERASVSERRYYTSDATVEKLGELLLANPRGLLVLRDELAGWLRTLERPGREGDREFFLESWNGDGAYTVDRIGRGTLHVPALCLSMLGTIQPGKLRAYLAAACSGGAGDDGLIQRFQLAIWPDVSGDWRNVDRWPESAARERAAKVYVALDALTPERIGASLDHGDIPGLRFEAAAQELFDAWRTELETRLRTPELAQYPAYEAHVSKYRSLMPALALLHHLVDVVGGSPTGVVSLDAARTAAAWVEYLDAHARRLYAVELDPGRAAARALAGRIEAGNVADGETLRDIQQRDWSGLRTVPLVRAAAVNLSALGWLRIERRCDTGGRPSEVVCLHPQLREPAS